MLRYKSFLYSLLLLTSLCWPAFAQTANSTLSGVVKDQNGDVIADVQVNILNTATSQTREVITGPDGRFSAPVMPPGKYSVTLFCDGFAPLEITGIALATGEEQVFRVELKVGTLSEQVTIEADAVSVSKTSPAVATTIGRQFIEKLPLNGQSLQSVITLTPGVVITPDSVGRPNIFSVNGQRPDANYFTVDGVSGNVGIAFDLYNSPNATTLGGTPALTIFGGTQGLAIADSVASIQVQTANYSARYGRQFGGQIEITSQSGTNKFNGNIYRQFRPPQLEQLDLFTFRTPQPRLAQFGGVLSGPLVKNKTFFLAAYEEKLLQIPGYVNFDNLNYLTRPIHPSLLPFIATPPANSISSNDDFYLPYNRPISSRAVSLRIDHRLTDQTVLFGRYHNAPSFLQNRYGNFHSQIAFATQTLTTGGTSILNNHTVNEWRANWSFTRAERSDVPDNFSGAAVLPESAYLPDFVSRTNTYVSLGFYYETRSRGGQASGSVNFAAGRSLQQQRQLALTDNVSLVQGSHRLQLGIDYRYLTPRYIPPFNTIYYYNINSQDGVVVRAGVSLIEQPPFTFSWHNFSAYAEDNWKVSPRTTLNIGLRWELVPPPQGKNGGFLLASENLNQPALLKTASRGTPLWATRYNNFAPRVGLAYQLTQRAGYETVIRSGFGIFYDVSTSNIAEQAAQLQNARIFESVTPIQFPHFSREDLQPWAYNGRGLLSLADNHLKTPYILQWNLLLQQSLGARQALSLAYVASTGRQLLTPNFLLDLPGQRQPFHIIRNGGSSDYHSLQLQFQRQLAQGWQATASYTLAKSLDTVVPYSFYLSRRTAFNFSQGRGPSDFDVRHNFSVAASYDVTWHLPTRLTRALFGNWGVSSLLKAQSAPPVEVTYTTSSNFNTISLRPDLAAGVPLYLSGQGILSVRRINPAAFIIPTEKRQGTLGRNALRGFGKWQTDISIRRHLSLYKKFKLNLTAELFNAFNQANFVATDGYLGFQYLSSHEINEGFGFPQRALFHNSSALSRVPVGGSRSVQFGLRLSF